MKSIFRRKEIEKIYEIDNYKYFLLKEDDYDSINMSIRHGDIVSDKTIGEYDVEMPLLEVGDEFFLSDIQEAVKIKSKMRSSDGSITYYVMDKLVNTENTIRTKAECDMVMKDFKEIKDKYSNYMKKYKYKHRFFNRKCSE